MFASTTAFESGNLSSLINRLTFYLWIILALHTSYCPSHDLCEKLWILGPSWTWTLLLLLPHTMEQWNLERSCARLHSCNRWLMRLRITNATPGLSNFYWFWFVSFPYSSFPSVYPLDIDLILCNCAYRSLIISSRL